jgi:hypothetical protein
MLAAHMKFNKKKIWEDSSLTENKDHPPLETIGWTVGGSNSDHPKYN